MHKPPASPSPVPPSDPRDNDGHDDGAGADDVTEEYLLERDIDHRVSSLKATRIRLGIDGAGSPIEPPPALDVPELPLPAVLPLVLGEDACPWLDDYIAFSRHWSPRSFDGYHEAIGLWLLSTVAARRVLLHHGYPRYTNLYVLLAGRSSLWAKTTAARIALLLLNQAGLSFFRLPDDATPQRFLAELAGAMPANLSSLDEEHQQRAIEERRFAGQRGWFYEEFGGKVKDMMREGSIMADYHSHLRRLDDCPLEYSSATMGRGREIIQGPYLALLGNVTPADLAASMKRESNLWSDGFWARFAFVSPSQQDQPNNEPFPEGECRAPNHLIEELRHWHDRLPTPDLRQVTTYDKDNKANGQAYQVTPQPPQVLGMSSDVLEARNAYDDALRKIIYEADEQDFDAWYVRLPEKALRLALLFTSLNRDPRVELRHWARAQQIAERWRACLHALYHQVNDGAKSPGEDLEERVLRLLLKIGKPATAREIAQRIRGMAAHDLQPKLELMVKANLLQRAENKGAVRYWFPTVGAPAGM